MKKGPAIAAVLCLVLLAAFWFAERAAFPPPAQHTAPAPAPVQQHREISGAIEAGETLIDIFRKHGLDPGELHQIRQASAAIYGLGRLNPGRPYRFRVDEGLRVDSFAYRLDDDCFLEVNRSGDGYSAERVPIPYEKRPVRIGGTIAGSLIASIGEGRENLRLALQLSDIFAWDIDFNTDLRQHDTFKVVVEGLYLDGRFVKYGEILAAEFVNNGQRHQAYGFAENGKTGYFDANGKALRKSFLKSPLNFRRISSGFSKGRPHPILKIVRPHHGLDYAAAAGTPVSAAGDGTVHFAGRQGQYGNLVILRHTNGYKTYYGHLQRFGKGIRKGRPVDQGSVIGYVGSTGLATGPHLHYEMRLNDRPINPLSQKIPRVVTVSDRSLAPFRQLIERMNLELASIQPAPVASGRPASPGSLKGG